MRMIIAHRAAKRQLTKLTILPKPAIWFFGANALILRSETRFGLISTYLDDLEQEELQGSSVFGYAPEDGVVGGLLSDFDLPQLTVRRLLRRRASILINSSSVAKWEQLAVAR